MRRVACLIALLVLSTTAYSQFNTIKKVKTLPRIQLDTAQAEQIQNSATPATETGTFYAVEKHATQPVAMPLMAPVINSPYGNRIDPLTGKQKFHYGIDFESSGDSVMVIMPGQVKKVAYSRGLGNYIEVEHGDFKTTYGHLSFVMVRERMKLEAGTVIGITGSTGRSTGDHLHFAIKQKGININPTPILDVIYRTLELNARKKAMNLTKN